MRVGFENKSMLSKSLGGFLGPPAGASGFDPPQHKGHFFPIFGAGFQLWVFAGDGRKKGMSSDVFFFTPCSLKQRFGPENLPASQNQGGRGAWFHLIKGGKSSWLTIKNGGPWTGMFLK